MKPRERASRRSTPESRAPRAGAGVALHAAAPAADSPLWRWAPRVVAALFAVALLAVIAGPHRVGDVFTETDFYGGYGPGARLIQQGRLDPSRYAVVGPGFEIVLAMVGFVVRDLFLAGELIAAASMTGALLLWSSLIRRRTHAALGTLVALFLATNAFWFRYGYAATTDALAIVLQAGALWLLLARAGSPRAFAAAGALAAAAYLTRWNAGVLLPAGLLAIAAGWADRAPGTSRRAAALAFAGGFAALALPWVAFSMASGTRFAVQLHHNIAYEVFARSKGIAWDVYQRDLQASFPTPWSVVQRDPAAVLSRIAFNVFDHLRLDARSLAGPALAACAAVGALLARREGWLARLAPLLAWAALVFVSLVPVFHAPRYSLPMLPVWAALAAAAFASPRFALAVGSRLWLKSALALIPLAIAVGANVAFQKEEFRKLPVEVLGGARVLHAQAASGDRVMARKPHLAWHAGLDPVPFPFADSLVALADAARRDRVRWLWFSWMEAELRPQFWWLLDTTVQVPGLVRRASYVVNPAVLWEIGPEFGRVPDWLRDSTAVAVHDARGRVRVNVRDARSRILIALWEREHGRWAEAQPWIEEALAIEPGQMQVATLAGDNLRRMGRAGDGAARLQAVLQADPGYAPARIALGWCALDLERRDDAAELWRAVVTEATEPATLRRMIELFDARAERDPAAAARARLDAIEAAR